MHELRLIQLRNWVKQAIGPDGAGSITRAWAVQVSSFGTLPRAMSTAASLGEQAAMADSRRSESAMSKVESIASTAVRAAAKMNVSPGLIMLQCRPQLLSSRFLTPVPALHVCHCYHHVTVTTMPYTRRKLRHVRCFPCTMCLLRGSLEQSSGFYFSNRPNSLCNFGCAGWADYLLCWIGTHSKPGGQVPAQRAHSDTGCAPAQVQGPGLGAGGPLPRAPVPYHARCVVWLSVARPEFHPPDLPND